MQLNQVKTNGSSYPAIANKLLVIDFQLRKIYVDEIREKKCVEVEFYFLNKWIKEAGVADSISISRSFMYYVVHYKCLSSWNLWHKIRAIPAMTSPRNQQTHNAKLHTVEPTNPTRWKLRLTWYFWTRITAQILIDKRSDLYCNEICIAKKLNDLPLQFANILPFCI